LGLSVSALPGPVDERSFNTNGKTCKAYATTAEFAQFEDLSGTPGSSTNAIPVPYKRLAYTGFTSANVFDLGLGLQPGVAPQSRPNYIVSRSGTNGGVAYLTSNFPTTTPETKVSLKNFWYGCSQATLLGLLPTAAGCTITVRGYTGKTNVVSASKQICSQTFTYKPTSILGLIGTSKATYSGAVNSKCTNADYFTFSYAPTGGNLLGGLLSTGTALVLDNVRYDVRSCTKY